MRMTGMRLEWKKSPDNPERFTAESVRFRFVMMVPKHGRVQLWVQHYTDAWATKPIDQRPCTTRRQAERVAQRFEDGRNSRRLR